MSAVLRFLFVIPIAFVFACVSAGFAMLWPFLETDGVATSEPLFWIQVSLGLLAQSAQVGATALTPWAVFMVASETLGVRSLILHMVAGVAAGYGVMRAAYGEAMPAASVQTAMVVAGLTFALVYWIFAGRNAGRWRRREARQPPASATPTQSVESPSEP